MMGVRWIERVLFYTEARALTLEWREREEKMENVESSHVRVVPNAWEVLRLNSND